MLFDLEGWPWLGPELEQAVAVALAPCSTLDEFWSLADRPAESPNSEADTDPEDAAVLARWGWPYQPPTTERGRRLCCRLARHLSRALSPAGLERVDPRLAYLACALAVEGGRGADWNWYPLGTMAGASVGALRAIWRRATDGRWRRWVGDRDEISFWTVILVNALISLLLVGSLVAQSMGWGDLGVPWHPALIGLVMAVASTFGFAFGDTTEGRWKSALTYTATPVLVYSGGLIELLMLSTKIPKYRPLLWSWICAVCGCVLPLALLITAPAGIALQILLGLVAAVQPLCFIVQYATVPTHPLIPSKNTCILFAFLRQAPTSANKLDSNLGPDPLRRKEELEGYALDALRMIGTLDQNQTKWGLISTPNGTQHRVRIGNYLGMRNGQIVNISDEAIELTEIVREGNGNWYERQATIRLIK